MRDFQKYLYPGLFRTKVIFQQLPGPGIFQEKNPGFLKTFQEA